MAGSWLVCAGYHVVALVLRGMHHNRLRDLIRLGTYRDRLVHESCDTAFMCSLHQHYALFVRIHWSSDTDSETFLPRPCAICRFFPQELRNLTPW